MSKSKINYYYINKQKKKVEFTVALADEKDFTRWILEKSLLENWGPVYIKYIYTDCSTSRWEVLDYYNTIIDK